MLFCDDNGENESESDFDDDEEAAYYESLLLGNESEEDVELVMLQMNDVQYELLFKLLKIKVKGLLLICMFEFVMVWVFSL